MSHPVISAYLKQFNPAEHLNCLQALSVIGISLLRGKFLTPESLYKLSIQLVRNPPAHSILNLKGVKGRQNTARCRAVKSSMHFRTRRPRRGKPNWNSKLYGSHNFSINQDHNANSDQYLTYKQIEQIK